MAKRSSTLKNSHSITFNKDTQTIAITWTRNPKEVERIFNNLHFFNITPTKKLMAKIENITLQKSSKEVTDIFLL